MSTHPKTGDVVEIRLSRGFAYAQMTHYHKRMGALLRVFNHCHAARPANLQDIIAARHSFQVFFPLKAALAKKLVSIVQNLHVPSESKDFPLFKNGVSDPKTGKVATWWLWDGEREWRIGSLTQEQRKLPICQVVNDTMLVELIERNWTPESDFGEDSRDL